MQLSTCQATSCKIDFIFHDSLLTTTDDNFYSSRNPRVPCHSMPQIDLSAWRENVVQGCTIGGKHTTVGESAFPSPCTSCICTTDGVS